MKKRRETLTIEDLLNFLDVEFDVSEPEVEIIKQILEQLQAGETVAPGDEFLCPGYILIIEGEPEDED